MNHQDAPVKWTLGQKEGVLSYYALLNLACGKIHGPAHFLLSNYLGVGLIIATCDQNLFLSLHTKDEECF